MPSALALFRCSSESPSCRSSLMFARKLGGVPVVCLVKGRRLVPSKSFNLVLAAVYRFWTDGRRALSPGKGASRQPLLIRDVCFSFFASVGRGFRWPADRPGLLSVKP